MAKHNLKKSILEKGGMMIEALAMLGLIAVVTPTMYKKSAERTLEVEDINTATTIRTYMNAINSFMSTNYTSIIKDMEEANLEDGHGWSPQPNDLEAFLPYKFNVGNSLYDFDPPTVSIVKKGNNLTAFALFPAKGDADTGIGQERTARIASLVGANGGYVRSPNNARGVGGIWSLSGGDYTNVFPSDSSNVYSLVISTSNAVNGSTQAGDLDNAKYLQRTFESDEEKWRNTMRTDLYLGGYRDNDEYPTDTPEDATLHSIRNVDTMIIGAETQPDGGNNGLYISSDVTNKNAYIGGSLKAAADYFFVDNDSKTLNFAKNGDSDEYLFKVSGERADVSQYGNLRLAEGFASDSYCGLVHIGGSSSDDHDFVLSATHGVERSGETELSLVRRNMFHMQTYNSDEFSDETIYDSSLMSGNIIMMRNGYHKVKNGEVSTAPETIQYNNSQAFPVIIGANTHVRGLLAADQLDTGIIRTASLKTGSEKVDDTHQWLEVDQNGVRLHGTYRATEADSDSPKIAMDVGSAGIGMRTGGSAYNDPDAATFVLSNFGDTAEDTLVRAHAQKIKLHANNSGAILLQNNGLAQRVHGREIEFGVQQDAFSSADVELTDTFSDYRIILHPRGNLDLVDSNFHIIRKDGADVYNVLSVRSNSSEEASMNNSYADRYVNGSVSGRDYYDLAVHGNTLFTGTQKNGSSESESDKHYLAIGMEHEKSGANITASTTSQEKNVLFVDLSTVNSDDNRINEPGSNDKFTSDSGYDLDQGTVYIRKGVIAALPEKPTSDVGGSGNDSGQKGKGIIMAGRFVANNIDKDGQYIEVKPLFDSATLNRYNGTDNTVRYDTYMVNPAYTSVMHDIKLTTRGGARLSDVLPDFITKAIYIASNDKTDDIRDLSFSLSGNSVSVSHSSGTAGSSNWASPYTGVVPTPQCPPGYMRVITVNPISMNMAQAGTLATQNGRHYIEESTMAYPELAQALNNGTSLDIHPVYRELKLKVKTGNTLEGASAGGATLTSSVLPGEEVEITNIKNIIADSRSDSGEVLYASTVKDLNNALYPFTFQQNTWLKSLVVPVCSSGTTSYGQTCGNNYTRAWAVLLGFIYPSSIYSDFIQGSGTVVNKNTSDEKAYWNVFPVVKKSLEATVTTYCYFNRANIDPLENMTGGSGTKFVDDEGYNEYIDPYHPLRNPIPSSYNKLREGQNGKYLERLNDPTLKYNEVW